MQIPWVEREEILRHATVLITRYLDCTAREVKGPHYQRNRSLEERRCTDSKQAKINENKKNIIRGSGIGMMCSDVFYLRFCSGALRGVASVIVTTIQRTNHDLEE